MDTFSSKTKSTLFTLDTFPQNNSTFGLSLFQRNLHEDSNPNFRISTDHYSLEDDQHNPFTARSKINIRQSYIYRVLGDDQNQRLPSLKHQHVFIFNWDDTLLFTSYLKRKSFVELKQDTKKYLMQLDETVSRILDFCQRKGFVFILTNELDQWIEVSSKNFLPKVNHKIHSSLKIILWSVRQMYQKLYPNDSKNWKISTFKKLTQYLRKNILTNVIFVGDQQDDLQACRVLANDFDLIYIKKIKMDERPTPEELVKQLKVLEKKMQQIFHAIANATIKLEKRILTPENIRKNN